MRSLITGIGGFAGGHLAAALLEQDGHVAGIDHAKGEQLPAAEDRLVFRAADIRDSRALAELAAASKPDVIFHLAALTHVAESWDTRRDTLDINVIGTASVLEVAAELDPKPTVVLASSGQVYGRAEADALPFSETDPLHPQSPYAVSKLCAELLARQAWDGEGVPTVALRTFNYTGPWQSPSFVCSDFARQIAWAEAGLGEPLLTVGNLEARRDFSDVRDIIDGYIAAATEGVPGAVYNLSSGVAASIGEVLEILRSAATVDIEVREDPARLRDIDLSVLCGDSTLARRELGWQPRIRLAQTLETVLEFWRDQARRAA